MIPFDWEEIACSLQDKVVALESERDSLRASLAVTTQATHCAECGVFKHTPWRDDEGYICAGCLGSQRDAAKVIARALQAAIREHHAGIESVETANDAGIDRSDANLWALVGLKPS